jgi:dCTP deaminase
MYLSDNDLKEAIDNSKIICDPTPKSFGYASFDVSLDSIDAAKIWDVHGYEASLRAAGHDPYLHIGKYVYGEFSLQNTKPVPEDPAGSVYRDGDRIIIKPTGFLLWQTLEKVGTCDENPEHICFINGRSSTARSGIVVHTTAPTINPGWSGKITLEIANLGPFNLCLRPGDRIASIIAAKLMNIPSGVELERTIQNNQSGITGT